MSRQIQNEEKRNGRDCPPRSRRIERWQIIAGLLMLYDVIVICGAYFLALLLRFDGIYSSIPEHFLKPFVSFIFAYAAFCVIVFNILGMYRTMWAFASLDMLIRGTAISIGASLVHTVLITLLFRRMPLTYYVVGAVFQLIGILAIRFMNRFRIYFIRVMQGKRASGKRIMLIGAGDAGQMILKDIRLHGNGDKVVCVIDDNPNKWNRDFGGTMVVGGRDEILSAVKKYKVDQIFLTMPSASMETKRDILNICSETDCEIKALPGVYQMIKGEVSVTNLKEVSVEDLLGRDPIKPDLTKVYEQIRGKTVLVTGGGGSIGSELCRQIAGHQPKQLIIFDVYENNAYEIQMELKQKYPELNLVTLIGSVRDSRRIFQVFEEYHPQIVYHAAAHKHVPLMEDSPCEAIKNNVIGTYKTAYAALANGAERFVLISTDKAVNPTNIMGASKRLCEMIVQSFDRKIKAGKADEIPQLFTHTTLKNKKIEPDKARTEFSAVRFGNVLGSNGSVIPLFRRQIEHGGPVTVTHPDIIRYFMTIPEAVSLVMLAGTSAGGGEIFILDMGSPVKIVTLARNLIRLSGLKPDVDIKIEYTGLRPGEKLYEEKLLAEEGVRKTENDLIHIAQPIPLDEDKLFRDLGSLMNAAYANDEAETRRETEQAVPTFRKPDTGTPLPQAATP